MNITDLKVNELYIWRTASIITIDKIISIYNHSVRTKIVKIILGNYYQGNSSYSIDFFCKNWRELTPLEKVKYL